MKISCTDMLTLLDEIFIVVIGVGTLIRRKKMSTSSFTQTKNRNKKDIGTEG